MGWYVHIHVCFSCDNNDGVARLAKEHLDKLPPDNNRPGEVRWFLAELATRSGPNPGPKGGLLLWGMIGNYTQADLFVEALKPFWKDLLSNQIEGGPLPFKHVLVFEEQEDSEQAKAYEISLDRKTKDVIVKKHDLPFCWGQM